MAAVPFGYNEPDSFTLALLSKDHAPVYPLFRFPITEERGNLPSFVSKTLKILDVIRLAGLFFGVFSFPLDLETEKLPPLVTWISIHEDVSGVIQNTDITETLKNVSVNEWKGRTIWLRFRGKEPESLHSVAEGIIESLMQAKPDKRPNLETLRKQFTNDFDKPANICEFSGDALAVELMHIIPFELGSGLIYGILKAIRSRANTIWVACEPQLAPFQTTEPIIGNVVLYNELKWGAILKGGPVRTINKTPNFLVGSAVVHKVADEHHGVLFSTSPRLWLAETVTHTLTAFTKEVSNDLLPSATPLARVKSNNELTAFLISSLADAATLYLRYATETLQERLYSVIERILATKDALKRKREREDEEEEEEWPKHKKAKPVKVKRTSHSAQLSDSLSGSDVTNLSLISSDPGSMQTEIDDLPIKKPTQEQYQSQNIWEGLLTHPDDLLYVEDVDEDVDERELTSESKQIIADLYQGLGVSEAVERHAAMHEKALAFLFMLCNWAAYAQ